MKMFTRGVRPNIRRSAVTQDDFFAESEADLLRGDLPSMAPPTAVQVGAFLRQAREQQGLSIGEMSRRTRIRDVYLFALEAGEVEKLPGATFVAGFLRLYAETLELTDRGFIERYLENSSDGDHWHAELFPPPVTQHHRPSVAMVLGGLIGLLLLFFVYENHFSSLSTAFRAPELPSTTPLRAGRCLWVVRYGVRIPPSRS